MRNHTEVERQTVSQQEIATPATTSNLKKKPELSTTKRLAYVATFTALALIMKFISQTWGGYLQLFSLKLSFIYIPWILAAVTLGPVDGMFVACLSDLIGILVLPTTGTIIPLMTLSNTLFPLFVWLAVRFIPIRHLYLKTVIGTCVSVLVCTLGLSTLALSLTYGTPFWAQLSLRWMQPIVIAVNLVIVGGLLPLMKKLRLLPE